jgi:ubiquitin carboxyl-terminal hydrolase 34
VESVVTNEASLDSLFPPGKFFQAKYAAQALGTKLEDQLHSVSSWLSTWTICADGCQSTFDPEFLANSIQLLDKALLSSDLIGSKTFASQGVQLAAVLIDVLLQFLRGESVEMTLMDLDL